MLAHMKKRHTDLIDLKFTGPMDKKDRAIDALKALGFVDTSDSVSWEEAFPEYEKSELSGITLTGARDKESLTQKELARLTNIPQGHTSEMENGKRPIGVKTAKKLGEALNINYRVFL